MGNLEIVLLSESEDHVVEYICCNTYLHDCVDQHPLGDEDVEVVILELLIHSKVHPTQGFQVYR